ncbi:Multidrug resistance protein 3 [compost metagenome]
MFSSGGGAASAPVLDFQDPHALLSKDTRALIPPEILSSIAAGLSSSIVRTFAWAVIPAVLALVAASFMGRQKMDASAEEPVVSGH